MSTARSNPGIGGPDPRLRAILIPLGVLCLSFLPGCGECVFEEAISGTVLSEDGIPVPDAVVTTCVGSGCAIGDSDTACVSDVTDVAGGFELVVPQCQSTTGECALRPLTIEREDCEPMTTQPPLRGEPGTYVMDCR